MARQKAVVATRKADAITMLKEDHANVLQLLKRLVATTGRSGNQRKTLFNKIETELKIHTRLEEEVFYPAFKDAAKRTDSHLYYESIEEHHLVDVVLPEMKAARLDSEEFSAKAKVLQDLIVHHAKDEEEKEMFPRARKAFTKAELLELGEKMAARKRELMAPLLTRFARSTGASLGRIVGGKAA